MREVSTVVPARPEEAFRVLEDPKSFARLVAGARRVRRFDPRWPEPGTVIHHTVGIPPILVRDTTEVLEMDPGRFLRLEARVRPIGALVVEFELTPDPGGCRLTVREAPRAGLLSRPGVSPFVEAVVALRNRDICRRYRHLVESRTPAGGTGA